ncbi:hypothetical protein PVAND_010167 [Polypedilum vanderplanki]|uniref:Uncharacterized protein n=1 Tax=Polypedilum vanderplanki TaxID=319348 RepID=A0A9J6CER1_POLVA|nr:hypothetical protein PVAND_010167 [Polypedilum vanderplanki]
MKAFLVILSIIFVTVAKGSSEKVTIECDSVTYFKSYFRSGAIHSSDFDVTCYIDNARENFDLIKTCAGFKSIYFNIICSNLTYLSTKNSIIKKIPSNFFMQVPKLTTFIATNVNLEEIHRDDFKDAENLIVLNMADNMIELLESEIFSYLKKLRILDLSNNKITSLDEETFIGSGDDLYEVYLSGNKINILDYNVFKPIATNKLYPLKLNMDSNKVQKIKESNEPNSIQFHVLSLNKNQISKFSCSGVKISEIYLEENGLETFDCDAQYISIAKNNVKVLKLQNNAKGLGISQNNIKVFSVDEKSEMMSLDMSDNGDISLQLEAVKNMTKLRRLSISSSFIGTVYDDLFAKMENLTYLYMNSCGLKSISSRLFLKNTELKFLEISNNQLEKLDLNVFIGSRQLSYIDISNNKLSRIGNIEKIKTILPELKQIKIYGNPWKCIEFSTIMRTLKQLNIKIADNEPINKNYDVPNVSGIPCY